MNPETELTTDLARNTLNEIYPTAKQITLVEHGYDNIVGLVDETYAVRFPRNADAYRRSQYEKSVLNSINQPQELEIPKVLDERSDPPCLITNFLHGTHLNAKELNGLTPEQQEQFAKDIAQFAYTLHKSLSVDEVQGFREKFEINKLDEAWGDCFAKHLFKADLPNPVQNELVKRYYGEWLKHETKENLVVIHDDLHADNLLFENGKLVGVLDFGDTSIGTPEQELRQLYRINETILKTAIETYSQISNTKLSFEAAKAWAIVQELGSYVDRLSTGSKNHPSFIRACNNLDNWLPEGEWGK